MDLLDDDYQTETGQDDAGDDLTLERVAARGGPHT